MYITPFTDLTPEEFLEGFDRGTLVPKRQRQEGKGEAKKITIEEGQGAPGRSRNTSLRSRSLGRTNGRTSSDIKKTPRKPSQQEKYNPSLLSPSQRITLYRDSRFYCEAPTIGETG